MDVNKGDNDNEGSPGSHFEALEEAVHVGDELEQAEGLEDAQRPEGQQDVGGQVEVQEAVHQGRNGHHRQDKVEAVPAILPIVLPAVGANFDDGFYGKQDGKEGVAPDEKGGGFEKPSHKDGDGVYQHQDEHHPVVCEKGLDGVLLPM